MITLPETRLEDCAAKGRYNEEQRPILCGVYYDGKGHAVACDGFILAKVPVEVEGEADLPGVIPTKAVKAARKAAGRGNPPTFDLSEEGMARFADEAAPLTEGNYPDYEVIIPRCKPGDEGTVTVGLNADNLMRVAKALHSDGWVALVIQIDKADSAPIKVYPLPGTYRGRLGDDGDGVGVVMPMWVNGR